MRRILFTLLAVILLVPAGLLMAQSRERAWSDTAIAAARAALVAQPDDEALKKALLDLLVLKQGDLRQQLSDLESEISGLRPLAWRGGCGDTTLTGPARVGGNVTAPMKIVDVPPVYPPDAQKARIQGMVIIEAAIDCNGTVTDARILRGQPMLSDAALKAVRQWRYDPALLEGKPVPVIMTVTVTFTLR